MSNTLTRRYTPFKWETTVCKQKCQEFQNCKVIIFHLSMIFIHISVFSSHFHYLHYFDSKRIHVSVTFNLKIHAFTHTTHITKKNRASLPQQTGKQKLEREKIIQSRQNEMERFGSRSEEEQRDERMSTNLIKKLLKTLKPNWIQNGTKMHETWLKGCLTS